MSTSALAYPLASRVVGDWSVSHVDGAQVITTDIGQPWLLRYRNSEQRARIDTRFSLSISFFFFFEIFSPPPSSNFHKHCVFRQTRRDKHRK